MTGKTKEQAIVNATYYGNDMRWMIWAGTQDGIFPADTTMAEYEGVFVALGVNSTFKVKHIENFGHILI
jgi:hypothetical protein